MTIWPIALCALGVAGTLAADLTGNRKLEWLGKPLAALSFILAAWLWGALDSRYGQWIFLGLVLGAAGDVLLIPKSASTAFLLGMVAFLLGHLAYALAFWSLPLDARTGWIATVATCVFAIFILRWLLPTTPAKFKGPVIAYQIVIGAMVILACAAVAAGAHWILAAGALGFAASDISVARNRFVRPGFVNRVWGIPLYFASQLVIAASVVFITAA